MDEKLSVRRAVGIVLCSGLFIAALFVFMRAHRYSAYKEARAEAKSTESAFPELESDLLAAARFPGHPEALGALGQIYLERALAENQFGSVEKREEFLDRARDALKEQIRKNPLDAGSFYRLGIVYTLYSYPFMIYAEQGWSFIVRALELAPSDEFLNVNGLHIFLTQWERLSPKERAFVWKRLSEIAAFNPSFISKIADLWSKNFGNRDGLQGILSQNESIWVKIKSMI
jgi:hypothetical protein